MSKLQTEMKGASKVIVGATLVMIVSCAILLGLVLIILAEIYCSRWFRRLRKPQLSSSSISSSSSSAIPISNVAISANSGVHSLSNLYSHGVIKAPRSLLFPSVEMQEQHHSQSGGLFEFCESSTDEEMELETASIPRRSVFTLQSSPPLSHLPPPKLVYEVSGSSAHDCGGGGNKDIYVYICNPMYDRSGSGRAEETQFETPDSSPSRLESDGSSSRGDDEVQEVESPAPVAVSNCSATPPLTPMKKLPAEAVSVPLRDAGSLASECESNSNNDEDISSCLSMTGTPCTSPSW